MPLPGGLSASPLDPTIISPLGSSSAFTSTSSNFNSFCTCSTSYEKIGGIAQLGHNVPLLHFTQEGTTTGNGGQPAKILVDLRPSHDILPCNLKSFQSDRPVWGREKKKKGKMVRSDLLFYIQKHEVDTWSMLRLWIPSTSLINNSF